MRGERALFLQEGQRWIRAAPSHLWDGEAGKEGEKGLQDKGSASWALLSVCLHIFFLRDTASRGGDRTKGNGGNPPLPHANREMRPWPPAYLRAVAAGFRLGVLLS